MLELLLTVLNVILVILGAITFFAFIFLSVGFLMSTKHDCKLHQQFTHDPRDVLRSSKEQEAKDSETIDRATEYRRDF